MADLADDQIADAEEPTTLRAVGYGRVSSYLNRVRGESRTEDDQIEHIRREVARQKATLVGYYSDIEASGGSRKKRPELEAALGVLERGEADILVVAHFSRLSRNVRDVIDILEELRARKQRMYSATEDLDPQNDLGLMTLMFMATFNQHELNVRRAYWKVTRAGAIDRGVHLGKTPVGYLRAYPTPKEGKPWQVDFARAREVLDALGLEGREVRKAGLIPDPETAPVVRWVFEKMAQRRRRPESVSMAEILAYLDGALPRTDGVWVPQQVYRMVSLRAYKGVTTHDDWDQNQTRVETVNEYDTHPPLVDSALWESAQRPEGALVRAESESHPLAGNVVCTGCSQPMNGNTQRNRQRRRLDGSRIGQGQKVPADQVVLADVVTRVYRCPGRRSKGVCEAPAVIVADALENELMTLANAELARVRVSIETPADPLVREELRETQEGILRAQDTLEDLKYERDRQGDRLTGRARDKWRDDYGAANDRLIALEAREAELLAATEEPLKNVAQAWGTLGDDIKWKVLREIAPVIAVERSNRQRVPVSDRIDVYWSGDRSLPVLVEDGKRVPVRPLERRQRGDDTAA